MIAVILGAGFSQPCGVPLASQLFDAEPAVDKITRRRLVSRVIAGWNAWKQQGGTQPEVYLAELASGAEKSALDMRPWLEAVKYVSLRIALTMGKVELVGVIPQITRHNLDRTVGCHTHEAFWDALFHRTDIPEGLDVITTNYDVLPERGLRPSPRPRRHRPGFHYGLGTETLKGGGYPSYTHIRAFTVSGHVPLLKLHGSVSWSVKNGELLKYHDCRPAIRGDAAIVAPVPGKSPPPWLTPIWHHADVSLRAAIHWIVVGYSFPDYDAQVNDLVSRSGDRPLRIDVFDPDSGSVAGRLSRLTPSATIFTHPGLPDAVDIVANLSFQRPVSATVVR